MKNKIIQTAILCLTLLISLNSRSANFFKLGYDSLSCLQLEGKVTNVANSDSEECTVELINGNDVEQTIVLKEGKNKFKFVLNKNSYYAIRISKNGFTSKLVSINTAMLVAGLGIHVFKFDVNLLPEIVTNQQNQDVIDFPVALIHFDYDQDSFIYDLEYSAYIKKELNKPNPPKIKRIKNVYDVETAPFALAK